MRKAILVIGIILTISIGVILIYFAFIQTPTYYPTYYMSNEEISLDDALRETPHALISTEERLFMQSIISSPDFISALEDERLVVILPPENVYRLIEEILPENARPYKDNEVTVLNDENNDGITYFDYFIFDEDETFRILLTASLTNDRITKTITIHADKPNTHPKIITNENNEAFHKTVSQRRFINHANN